jgi:hypothetical protein
MYWYGTAVADGKLTHGYGSFDRNGKAYITVDLEAKDEDAVEVHPLSVFRLEDGGAIDLWCPDIKYGVIAGPGTILGNFSEPEEFRYIESNDGVRLTCVGLGPHRFTSKRSSYTECSRCGERKDNFAEARRERDETIEYFLENEEFFDRWDTEAFEEFERNHPRDGR